jgi:hypothetical protein
MYLVVLSHTMDDLPIRLCKTREEAEGIAAGLDGEVPEPIAETFMTDASTPCCVKIVEFNDAGEVTEVSVVKDFT